MDDQLRDEMSDTELEAIRARLDEPPPVIALASRNQGLTPIVEYLALLRQDRIHLVDELDRLRAEMAVVLQKLDADDAIDAETTAGDIEALTPNPEVFLTAMKTVSIDPDRGAMLSPLARNQSMGRSAKASCRPRPRC